MANTLYISIITIAAILLSSAFRANNTEKRELILIFTVSLLSKLFFFLVWTIYKAGFLDPNYLQFPDEHTYLGFDGGSASNVYFYIVYYLKGWSVDIFTLKFLNMAICALSAARIYSVIFDYKESQPWLAKYIIILYALSPLTAYFSVFVLREAFIFLLLSELFVRLLRPNGRNTYIYIPALILILSMFRTEFIGFFIIYIMRMSMNKQLLIYSLAGAILIAFAPQFSEIYYSYARMGLYHNVFGGDPLAAAVRVSTASLSTTILISVISANISSSIMPSINGDFLIFVFHMLIYIPIVILLSEKKNRVAFMRQKIIWVPLLLMCFGGLVTFFNFRYFAVLAQFIVLAMIVSGGNARDGVGSRYSESIEEMPKSRDK